MSYLIQKYKIVDENVQKAVKKSAKLLPHISKWRVNV